LNAQKDRLNAQRDTLRGQDTELGTFWVGLRVQWHLLDTRRARLTAHRSELDRSGVQAELYARCAALYDPQCMIVCYEKASLGVEHVRERQGLFALLPSEATDCICSCLDVRPGLNIYRDGLNKALPLIVTVAVAEAEIEWLIQRAWERG